MKHALIIVAAVAVVSLFIGTVRILSLDETPAYTDGTSTTDTRVRK